MFQDFFDPRTLEWWFGQDPGIVGSVAESSPEPHIIALAN
jgi:hypothetical protein